MPALNPLNFGSSRATASASSQALAKRPPAPTCEEDTFVTDDLRTHLRVALEARDVSDLKNLTARLDRPTAYRLLNSPCDRGLDPSVTPADVPEMPICMAADSGSVPMMLQLIRSGALPTLGEVVELNVEGEEAELGAPRQTLYPAYYAAKQGHVAVLDTLETRGCPMGSVLTGLNERVSEKTVAWLVQRGHAGKSFAAAMERAILEQRCPGVQTLVKVGDVDLKEPAECDPHGWLHYALDHQCWDAAKMLVALGAPVNGLPQTTTADDLPLAQVIASGQVSLADALIAQKVATNALSLQKAIESNAQSSEMFGTLFSAGVSLSKKEATDLFSMAYDRKLGGVCLLLSVQIRLLTAEAAGKSCDSDLQEMRAQCAQLANDCRMGIEFPFDEIFTGEMTADLGGVDLDTMPSNHWAAKGKAKLKSQMKRAVEQVKVKPRDKAPTKQRLMIGGSNLS